MFLNNSSRKMQIKANLLMYGNVGGGNYAAITTLFIGSTVCIICPYTEYILYSYIYFISYQPQDRTVCTKMVFATKLSKASKLVRKIIKIIFVNAEILRYSITG